MRKFILTIPAKTVNDAFTNAINNQKELQGNRV